MKGRWEGSAWRGLSVEMSGWELNLTLPFRLYRIFSKSGKAQTPLINEASGDDNRSKTGNRFGSVRMELWLIDVLSGQVFELETSPKWLESHMKKIKHHETLHRLAQMSHQWQTAVQHCLRFRNEGEATGRLWRLFSIGFPRKVSRVPLFGHYHGDGLIQLAICQREDSHVSNLSKPWMLPQQLQIAQQRQIPRQRQRPPQDEILEVICSVTSTESGSASTALTSSSFRESSTHIHHDPERHIDVAKANGPLRRATTKVEARDIGCNNTYESHDSTRDADADQVTTRAEQRKSGQFASLSKVDKLLQGEEVVIVPTRFRYQRSLHDSDSSELSERAARGRVRSGSRSNVGHATRRLTEYKSSARTVSRQKDPKHEPRRHRRATMRRNAGPTFTEAKEDDEDLIARTLKKYSTFNNDSDSELVASSDDGESSDLSDYDTFDMTTLEQAKKTLRRLVEKREKASKDGDLMTESDLKFYVIPDVEARIQQLTSQREQGQPEQGLENHEAGGERDGRQGPFQPEVPAYDPDDQMEESNVPDASSGTGDPRQDSESVQLEVGDDGEGEIDPRSA